MVGLNLMQTSRRRIAALLLFWDGVDALARPAPQDNVGSTTASMTEITSTATVDGSVITEIYTPTSIAESGLVPPITAATTVTTTDAAGQTIAIAIAAGAGVVAGGALAAWLFKPIAGAPPAPTTPPPYSTSEQAPETTESITSSTSTLTSTSSEAPACPFPSSGYPISFAPRQDQPQWTAALPSVTTSTIAPKCTQQGNNNQLLRGTIPDYINQLAAVFCKHDLSKDETMVLSQSSLPDDSSLKNSNLDGIRVKFDFKFGVTDDGCSQNCIDAYSKMITSCEYDSHSLYGGASLEQGCGTYDFVVDADPIIELECAPPPNPYWSGYMYRQAALDAIDSFCTARDGSTLKQGDTSTNIVEEAFSIVYADGCTGSGSYGVTKDLCTSYLIQALDSCDTTTTMYKHGGTVTDTDNCGAFTFHPVGYDDFYCYPKNSNVLTGTAIGITPDVARDAISQFCDRDGKKDKYTLDPSKSVPSGFTGNSCTTDGLASCLYYYNSDGSRVTKKASIGDMVVNLSASYTDASNCGPRKVYEIHGDRCHAELNKLIGVDPQGTCVDSDPNQLKLGSFVEHSDEGCVLWTMYALATHG